MDEPKLTPSEDLAVDVLMARTRLGESLWTFEARHKKTLEKLEEKGLVRVMHGIVENTVRASLTEKARSIYLSGEYVSPVEKKAAEIKERADFWQNEYNELVAKSGYGR